MNTTDQIEAMNQRAIHLAEREQAAWDDGNERRAAYFLGEYRAICVAIEVAEAEAREGE